MRLLICAFVCSVLFFSNARAQTRIIAQVNDEIISERDLEQRLAFIRLTGQADTSKKDIQDRMLKQLIDEKLKQQEARNAGIQVSEDEINQAIKITLRQNGLDYDKVLKILKKNKLPLSVISDQIKSDLLYVRAIKKMAGARVNISDSEVSTKIEEIKENLSQRQYLTSEIFLPVGDEPEDQVYGQAMQLILRMRDGESFEDLAQQYSKAPSAAKGGMAGWVAEKNFTPAELEELSFMRPGQLSTPIQTPEGYKLLVYHAVREPENISEKKEVVHLMQLFLPETMTKNQRQSVLRDVNLTKGSCQQFKTVSQNIKTTSRIDLGKLPMTELPSPIRSVVSKTALLTPSRPLKIDGGELVFMACSKENVSLIPEKEKVKMQLESMRLEMLAQRRLRELRRNAVTEIRR